MWNIQNSFTVGGKTSRRSVLQVGAFTGLGLTLADLLRLNPTAKAGEALPRSIIHIFLAGGPSHLETFDPKPEAPIEIRGPYNPVATNVAGTFISETLPYLSKLADKYSLVRACCHDNTGHNGGQRYVCTGYKSASLEEEQPHDYPYVGAYLSKVRGAMHAGMPNYLQMGGGDKQHAAFLGPACAPFSVYSTGKPEGLEITPSIRLDRMSDRRNLLHQLDTLRRHAEVARKMNALDSLEQQAYEMLTSTAAHDAFDMQKETESTRQRYGAHEAGRTCLLARRFVEAGAGFVWVRFGSWDHHGNAGGTITEGVNANNYMMDQGVSALIEDLEQRGLKEQVLVLVWGEFGRTPRINQSFGRDHWPAAMSILLAGGGLKSGRVVGATNHKGEHPVERSFSPADVLATVYRQLGVDPAQKFLNASGRPVAILDHGKPIQDLL